MGERAREVSAAVWSMGILMCFVYNHFAIAGVAVSMQTRSSLESFETWGRRQSPKSPWLPPVPTEYLFETPIGCVILASIINFCGQSLLPGCTFHFYIFRQADQPASATALVVVLKHKSHLSSTVLIITKALSLYIHVNPFLTPIPPPCRNEKSSPSTIPPSLILRRSHGLPNIYAQLAPRRYRSGSWLHIA